MLHWAQKFGRLLATALEEIKTRAEKPPALQELAGWSTTVLLEQWCAIAESEKSTIAERLYTTYLLRAIVDLELERDIAAVIVRAGVVPVLVGLMTLAGIEEYYIEVIDAWCLILEAPGSSQVAVEAVNEGLVPTISLWCREDPVEFELGV